VDRLSKRTKVYFDPEIHRALKRQAVLANTSVSELVDEAIRLVLADDELDLATVSVRSDEPFISYEMLINDLKKHGKF
jgi:hypothetical protein